MSNAKTQITIRTLAERAAGIESFKVGFMECMKGNEYVYDKYENTLSQMYYERGRAFAIYTQMMKEKVSRWVKGKLGKAGQERIVRAYMGGYIR